MNMKFFALMLVCMTAAAMAVDVQTALARTERLKADGDVKAATGLQNNDCAAKQACQQKVTYVSDAGASAGNEAAAAIPSVSETIKPIDDWLSAFKKRAGAGGDLFAAAKATVQPLIEKLKSTQKAAVEKLKLSNDAILSQVEQAAAQHVYNILNSEKKEEDKKEDEESKEEEKKDLQEEAKEKKDLAEALSSGSASGESSAATSESSSGAAAEASKIEKEVKKEIAEKK